MNWHSSVSEFLPPIFSTDVPCLLTMKAPRQGEEGISAGKVQGALAGARNEESLPIFFEPPLIGDLGT
jgi:hypothetical protein